MARAARFEVESDMRLRDRFTRWARRLKRHLRVLLEIIRHPDLPWYVWLAGVGVAAYALSPIDLIPDFIPILGYLDDLILLPLGYLLVLRLTPRYIRIEAAHAAARASARSGRKPETRLRLAGALIVVAVWAIVASLITLAIVRRVR
jgi:uncharacterized membrane protein YkvA (DUF1232 family)